MLPPFIIEQIRQREEKERGFSSVLSKLRGQIDPACVSSAANPGQLGIEIFGLNAENTHRVSTHL